MPKTCQTNLLFLAGVTDFCCNVFFLEITRNDQSGEWKAIRPRFWRVDNRVLGNGIKHWP